MTKQELLTKLATDCATWADATELCAKIEFAYLLGGGALNYGHVSEQDWLAERERLLNKPSWKDAPEGAICKAMDKDGDWYFYLSMPTIEGDKEWWEACENDDIAVNSAIAIPAGYDWRESLEERPA